MTSRRNKIRVPAAALALAVVLALIAPLPLHAEAASRDGASTPGLFDLAWQGLLDGWEGVLAAVGAGPTPVPVPTDDATTQADPPPPPPPPGGESVGAPDPNG